MNVEILSVCLSVCMCLCVMDRHDIRFLCSRPFTNFYVIAAHGHNVLASYILNSEKTQRLLGHRDVHRDY